MALKWFSKATPAEPTPERKKFSAAIGSDYATWKALVQGYNLTGRVSRNEAMQVAAVVRARNLICNTIASLPLHATNALAQPVANVLLSQPESLKGYVRTVTITRTVEDLLFEGSSLWYVVQRDSTNFPKVVERIPHGHWTQDTAGTIRIGSREVDTSDVILFTSPNDPFLVSAGPAIRTLILLEKTAALYAESPEAIEYFTPTDGVDPEEDEIEAFLNDWQDKRRARSTAFIPAQVELHHSDRMTPEELQLATAREFAIKEIARLAGIEADWESVSTTSRTYLNVQDARRSFIDFTLTPYLKAIEERLSLNDVLPNGQRALFNLNYFLRANTSERYNAHAIALTNGFLTLPEVRALEDLPNIGDS